MSEDEQKDCYGLCASMHHDDVPVFVPPRDRKAKISLWTDINVSDTDTLFCLDTPTLIRCHLVTVFRLDDHEQNPRSAAVLEMFYHAVQFTRECCFTRPQTAAFLSILRQVHDMCVETPFDNMDACHCFLRELVLCHSVQRPPFSLELFSLDDSQRIVGYVTDTYFRHFKLYKYVFTPDISLDLNLNYPNIPPAESVLETPTEDTGKEEKPVEKPAVESEETVAQESEECSTLRRIIRLRLTEELGRLKNCADMQMTAAKEAMEEKLDDAEKQSGAEIENKKPEKKGKGGMKK